MRIVIDTNVWVSGLLWRGLPGNLLHLVETGQVKLYMDSAMLEELANVLSYDQLQPRLEELGLSVAEIILYAASLATILEVPEGEQIVVADPDDDVFIRCAMAVDAVCIVSGDRHLLDLKEHAGIPIVTVREFLSEAFPRFSAAKR